MTKQRSPVTLTGGGGFAFEDTAAAYFAAQMLSSGKYLGAEFGSVTSISFQARELGWLLDDLLVTLSGSTEPRSVAISIKSNKQVTRNGFPVDFVRAAWEQWFGTESDVFREGRDVLALAVGQVAGGVKSAWDEMLREALAAESDRVARRIKSPRQSSGLKRALFESLQCPPDLRDRGPSDVIATTHLLVQPLSCAMK